MPGHPLLSGQADGTRMESRDPALIPEVKIEIDVAEEMPEAWLPEGHAKGLCNRLQSCVHRAFMDRSVL